MGSEQGIEEKSAWRSIIAGIADRQSMTEKQAEKVVRDFAAVLEEEIRKRGRVSLPRFGVFSVRNRKAKIVYLPVTQRKMRVPRSRTVGFRRAKHWAEAL